MALSEAQFLEPLTYSQGSIRNQLVHTMWADEVWLTRLIGELSPTYLAEAFQDRASIQQHWHTVSQRWHAVLSGFSDEALVRVFAYKNTNGQLYHQTALQILLHVVNHATDHRAQTLAMMHTLGATTVEQDFIIFLREHP